MAINLPKKIVFAVPYWAGVPRPYTLQVLKDVVDKAVAGGYTAIACIDEITPQKCIDIRAGKYDVNLDYIRYAHSKGLKVMLVYNWNRYVDINAVGDYLTYQIFTIPAYYTRWINDFELIVNHYKQVNLDIIELEEPTYFNQDVFITAMFRTMKQKIVNAGLWDVMNFGINNPMNEDVTIDFPLPRGKQITYGLDWATIKQENLLNHMIWQSSAYDGDGFRGEHEKWILRMANSNIEIAGACYAYYPGTPLRYVTGIGDQVRYALSKNISITTFEMGRLQTDLSKYPPELPARFPGETIYQRIAYIFSTYLPPPATGTISVSSTPSGASITLTDADGTGSFGVTPRPNGIGTCSDTNPNACPIRNVKPGINTLRLDLTGYEPIIDNNVIVVAGENTIKHYDFTAPCVPVWQCEQPLNGNEADGCGNRRPNSACIPVPGGSISFSSVPGGAEIFLDGQDQGIQTPATITDVPAGSHTYALKMANYKDSTGTVELLENQIYTVSAILTKILKKGTGAGILLGIGLLGAGILGAVIMSKREKKYSPPKEYLKYQSTSK